MTFNATFIIFLKVIAAVLVIERFILDFSFRSGQSDGITELDFQALDKRLTRLILPPTQYCVQSIRVNQRPIVTNAS